MIIMFIVALSIAAGTAQGQTLFTETTWGGAGSDVAEAVATSADGSSYVVGITDSFAVDQFGNPSARIFVVKFAADGSLTWQRIWNGTTIRGLGRPDVAVSADGSAYVTGVTADNGNDAVLLKFNASGTLLWERTWGGSSSDESLAVATASDGSAYIAGTATSFGSSSAGLFVVKFDSAGNLVWQRMSDGAAGNAVAVGPDGSVYAAGTTPRPDQIGNFDILVLKITSDGSLVWQRTYSAGEVVDPRGRMTTAPDGSIVLAGAIQAAKAGLVDIAALIVKLSPDGGLLFDKQFAGRNGETAEGSRSLRTMGRSLSPGRRPVSAPVLRTRSCYIWNQPARKRWEWSRGEAQASRRAPASPSTEDRLARRDDHAPPPYSLRGAAAKLSAPKGYLAVVLGALTQPAGTSADPAAGATAPNRKYQCSAETSRRPS